MGNDILVFIHGAVSDISSLCVDVMAVFSEEPFPVFIFFNGLFPWAFVAAVVVVLVDEADLELPVLVRPGSPSLFQLNPSPFSSVFLQAALAR